MSSVTVEQLDEILKMKPPRRRPIPYKDTKAAPGSQLYAALEAGNKTLAERIYQQCEHDARELIRIANERAMLAVLVREAPFQGYLPRGDRHCQTGWADFCLAGRRDGVTCPEESCDIEDGVRKA